MSGDCSLSGYSPLKGFIFLSTALRREESLQLSGIQYAPAFTSVSGNPCVTGRESDYAAAAVVGTALTDQTVDLGKGKIMQGMESNEGRRRTCSARFSIAVCAAPIAPMRPG